MVRWVVQEGSAFCFSPASMAAVSSGASGFYSGPIRSSILVAGYLFGLAAGGPFDLAAHADFETFAGGLLAGDGDFGA